jgi:hypothetical protein
MEETAVPGEGGVYIPTYAGCQGRSHMTPSVCCHPFTGHSSFAMPSFTWQGRLSCVDNRIHCLIALFALLPIRPSCPIRPFMYNYIYTTYVTNPALNTMYRCVCTHPSSSLLSWLITHPKGKKNGKTLACFQRRPNTNVNHPSPSYKSFYRKHHLI